MHLFNAFLLIVKLLRESGMGNGIRAKMPKRKKAASRGTDWKHFWLLFPVCPAGSRFLRLGIFGPDSVSHPEIPLQTPFPLEPGNLPKIFFK